MRYLFLLVAVVLSGCAGDLSKNTRQALSVVVPHDVDFEELKFYALRARSAYDEPQKIRADYEDVTRVKTVTSVDVRYFIETDDAARSQTISVRGTAENENVWQDIAITLEYDSVLGAWLHRGFREDALAVWLDAKPHLRQDYELRVTGHSLGAAIALLIGGYSNKEGYNVVRVVNFGQPKVTATDLLPENLSILTRVIDDNDVVPMLPPPGFVPKYRHEGSEVILRPGEQYVYLDAHDADRVSIAEFWREFQAFSVEEHKMDRYIENLDYKLENGTRQVPYFSLGN